MHTTPAAAPMTLTAYELAQPWPCFGAARFTITLTSDDPVIGQVVLDGRELCDLCAAVELDRFGAADMHLIRAHLDQRRRTRLPWRTLTTGAHGLERSDAPGAITIAEVLRCLRLTVVRVEVGAGVDGVTDG